MSQDSLQVQSELSGVNKALLALTTHNSGPSEPTPTYPYMFWADTTSENLKVRTGDNTAWVVIGSLDANNFNLTTDIALAESTGYGVISGLGVTVSGMTATVEAGIAHMPSGKRYEQSTDLSLAIPAADATYPRIDLIYLDNTMVLQHLAGTPAASPISPTLPDSGLALTNIAVAAGATSITSANITDVRIIKDSTFNQYINTPKIADFIVKRGPWVDVEAFKSLVSGDDWTIATQAAIDYAHTYGLSVRFRNQSYKITSPLTIYSTSKLFGDHQYGTRILCYSSFITSSIQVENVRIADIFFYAYTTDTIISVDGMYGWDLNRVKFLGGYGHIEMLATESTKKSGYNFFRNCHFYNDSNATKAMISGSFVNGWVGANSFIGGRVGNNSSLCHSVDFNACSSTRFIAMFFEGTKGFKMINGSVVTCECCHLEYTSESNTSVVHSVDSASSLVIDNDALYQGSLTRGSNRSIILPSEKSETRSIIHKNGAMPVTIEHQTGNLCTNPLFYNNAYGWNTNASLSIDTNKYPDSVGSRIVNLTTNTTQTYFQQFIDFSRIPSYRPGDFFLISFKMKKPSNSVISSSNTTLAIAEYSPIKYWYNNAIGSQLVAGEFSHIMIAVTPPTNSTTLTSMYITIYLNYSSYVGSSETWQLTEPCVVFCSRYTPLFEIDTRLRLSAAPTDGTWRVGDKVYNAAPVAGGYEGWICVAGGIPGTWKGFGLIQS